MAASVPSSFGTSGTLNDVQMRTDNEPLGSPVAPRPPSVHDCPVFRGITGLQESKYGFVVLFFNHVIVILYNKNI